MLHSLKTTFYSPFLLKSLKPVNILQLMPPHLHHLTLSSHPCVPPLHCTGKCSFVVSNSLWHAKADGLSPLSALWELALLVPLSFLEISTRWLLQFPDTPPKFHAIFNTLYWAISSYLLLQIRKGERNADACGFISPFEKRNKGHQQEDLHKLFIQSFRAHYGKEISHHRFLYLAENQRQAREWESFII